MYTSSPVWRFVCVVGWSSPVWDQPARIPRHVTVHHQLQICPGIKSTRSIDDFRGACAVKGNVQVAGRTSSVSTTEMLSTHDVTLKTLTVHYFMFKFDLSWGIRTKMGKTEGIFLNLQCDCHRVASMFIKLINLYTNVSTLLPNVIALWINGVSLNSLAHTFYIVRTGKINKSL